MNCRQLSVSVVMPCFNAAETVSRALRAVASQSLPPVEVVAVDDGSTDDTRVVLETAATESWPFRLKTLWHHSNRGVADARNAALAAIDGDISYVAFLDADDWWLPEKLKRQIDWMEDHPDISWTAHRCVVGDPDPKHDRSHGPPLATRISVRRLLFRNPIATATVVVRRPVPSTFRSGWRHCEDLMAWIDWLNAGCKAAMIEQTLACLGRLPASRGGLCGNHSAMYGGELEIINQLERSRVLGTLEAAGWRAHAWLRHNRRGLCR